MKHPAQEADLVPGRRIAGVVIGVVIATISGVLLAYGIGACASSDPSTRWMSGSPAPIPAEVNAMETSTFTAEAQGLDLNRRAEAYLSSYGWVDRDREIVHVPIEVAYRLYLARRHQEDAR